jgi:hypothetical protein
VEAKIMYKNIIISLVILMQTDGGKNLIEWALEWIEYFFSLIGRLSFLAVPFLVLISSVLIAAAVMFKPAMAVLRGERKIGDALKDTPMAILVIVSFLIVGGCALSSFLVVGNVTGQIAQAAQGMPGGELVPTWPSPP